MRLTPDQVAHYYTEGYLVVPGVFTVNEMATLGADVDRVARERHDLIDPLNMRVRFKPDVRTNVAMLEVLDPIADLAPVAHAVAHDARLLALLHDLYDEPACLFKEKLIYKPAGALGATLHQDWIAWPGFPESFLTVIVAIDPFTAESGATEVFPRCHTHGYLSPKDGQHHYVERTNLPTAAVPLVLAPGDIAIFGCFMPHRSAPNTSEQPRRGYFLSYNARSDGGEQYARHYAEFHAWIKAKAPATKREALYFR